jgi:hypothetical protein
MNTPQIIIAEPQPGSFRVSVIGRFGGGFDGLHTDKQGVIARLTLLKSYDCGEKPANVICPESLRGIFVQVFPRSLA